MRITSVSIFVLWCGRKITHFFIYSRLPYSSPFYVLATVLGIQQEAKADTVSVLLKLMVYRGQQTLTKESYQQAQNHIPSISPKGKDHRPTRLDSKGLSSGGECVRAEPS